MKIIDALLSVNSSQRRPGSVPTAIIIHDTGAKTASSTLDWFRRVEAGVSSHYLIDRDGTTYRLVPEERQAWHAGLSSLWGREGVNEFSIGIELVDADNDGVRDPYPAAQLAATAELVAEICRRYRIPLHAVVGHQHVAPGRKVDPGPDFDFYNFLLAVAAILGPPRGDI